MCLTVVFDWQLQLQRLLLAGVVVIKKEMVMTPVVGIW